MKGRKVRHEDIEKLGKMTYKATFMTRKKSKKIIIQHLLKLIGLVCKLEHNSYKELCDMLMLNQVAKQP